MPSGQHGSPGNQMGGFAVLRLAFWDVFWVFTSEKCQKNPTPSQPTHISHISEDATFGSNFLARCCMGGGWNPPPPGLPTPIPGLCTNPRPAHAPCWTGGPRGRVRNKDGASRLVRKSFRCESPKGFQERGQERSKVGFWVSTSNVLIEESQPSWMYALFASWVPARPEGGGAVLGHPNPPRSPRFAADLGLCTQLTTLGLRAAVEKSPNLTWLSLKGTPRGECRSTGSGNTVAVNPLDAVLM